MARKFHSVRVVPICATTAVATGSVLSPTCQLPTGVRNGQSVLLKSVAVYDREDKFQKMDIVFYRRMRDSLGVSGITAIGAAVNITDSNLWQLEPIGNVSLNNAATGVEGYDSSETSDLINTKVVTRTNIDLILQSHVDEADEESTTSEGNIYFALINRGSSIGLTHQTGFVFQFGFETIY